jgi:hypothetical protein
MKSTITLSFILILMAGLASAQQKKPKMKRLLPRDSVYAYQVIPKTGSGNPLVFMMPVDSSKDASVKMPNAYRKGIIEPVPMPTHWVEMVKPKKKPDSSGEGYVAPVPMPNHKVKPVKPKNR